MPAYELGPDEIAELYELDLGEVVTEIELEEVVDNLAHATDIADQDWASRYGAQGGLPALGALCRIHAQGSKGTNFAQISINQFGETL